MDHELSSLLALLKATPEHPAGTPDRRRFVAEQAGVSADNLYQVARKIPLASGRPRRLGRDVKERLTAAFPGWLDAPSDASLASVTRLEPAPPERWPHDRFPLAYWQALTAAERIIVEEAMLDAYDRLMARREQLRAATEKQRKTAA